MRRVLRTCVSAAAAAAAVVLAASGVQAAGPPGWRFAAVFPQGSSVDVVAATGARDAWAAGAGCSTSDCTSTPPVLVKHWNGKTWATMHPPGGLGGVAPGTFAFAVAASSAANAWVFAGSNRGSADVTVAQHWTAKGWAKPAVFQEWAGISAAVTSGPKDAWAFGNLLFSAHPGYAVHYNGATWTRLSFPLIAQAASELSARNIWVVGSWAAAKAAVASPFAVEHWTGSAWHKVPVPRLRLPKGEAVQASNVVADGPDDVWAAGFLSAHMGVAPGIALLHWNGKVFTQVNVPYPVTGSYSLAGDGAGGFWLYGTEYGKTSFQNHLYHYNGGHWTRGSVPDKPKNSTQVNAMAWIPGTRSVWATGFQSLTSRSSGETQGVVLKYGP